MWPAWAIMVMRESHGALGMDEHLKANPFSVFLSRLTLTGVWLRRGELRCTGTGLVASALVNRIVDFRTDKLLRYAPLNLGLRFILPCAHRVDPIRGPERCGHRQTRFESRNRLLQPHRADLALANCGKRSAEIVLCRRPVERRALAGELLQRGAVGRNCPLQPHRPWLALAEVPERSAEASAVRSPPPPPRRAGVLAQPRSRMAPGPPGAGTARRRSRPGSPPATPSSHAPVRQNYPDTTRQSRRWPPDTGRQFRPAFPQDPHLLRRLRRQ